MSWAAGADACALDVDFRSMRSHVELMDSSGSHQAILSLADGEIGRGNHATCRALRVLDTTSLGWA